MAPRRADPSIADALKAVGLTAQQEEAERIAFIRALTIGALAGQGLVPVAPTSVVTRNLEFLKAHETEGKRLQGQIAECHGG